jgi:hypothetical protein
MSKGTLHIVSPDGVTHQQRVETSKGPSLDVLQAAVGGYIERVSVRYEGKVRDAYINEEGKLKGLNYNRDATRMWHAVPVTNRADVLVGPVAVWVPDAKVKKA